AVPRHGRDLAVERNRRAAVGRRVVDAWEELLPATGVALEERVAVRALARRRARRRQAPGSAEQELRSRRPVDERADLRAALRQDRRLERASRHDERAPAGDGRLTHRSAASPGCTSWP